MAHDNPPAVMPAVPYSEDRYANPPRSWQVIMTGDLPDPIPPGLVAKLGRLLDLRRDIGCLFIDTDDGGMLVARDWPSDYLEEADMLLARIEHAPGICGVTLNRHHDAAL